MIRIFDFQDNSELYNIIQSTIITFVSEKLHHKNDTNVTQYFVPQFRLTFHFGLIKKHTKRKGHSNFVCLHSHWWDLIHSVL